MNFFISGYHSHMRLARVQRGRSSQQTEYPFPSDELFITGGTAVFQSDGYALTPENSKQLFSLQTGDILLFAENGVASLIYSHFEKEATVFLTGHCNSNCLMCPMTETERTSPDEVSAAFLQQYLALLPESVAHLVVTGGEPTLRRNLFLQCLQKIRVKFPQAEILLLTNGRSFSDRAFLQEALQVAPANLFAAIPLHGPTAALHDSITRAPGSFAQTTQGIRNLLEQKARVEIRIVVSRLNASFIPELVRLIGHQFPTVSIVNFIGLETRGNCAAHFQQVYLDPEASFRAIRGSVLQLLTLGIPVSLYNFPLCAVEPGFWSLCKKSISPEKVRFPASCSSCSRKSSCGGFFQTTLHLGNFQVSPM